MIKSGVFFAKLSLQGGVEVVLEIGILTGDEVPRSLFSMWHSPVMGIPPESTVMPHHKGKEAAGDDGEEDDEEYNNKFYPVGLPTPCHVYQQVNK